MKNTHKQGMKIMQIPDMFYEGETGWLTHRKASILTSTLKREFCWLSFPWEESNWGNLIKWYISFPSY